MLYEKTLLKIQSCIQINRLKESGLMGGQLGIVLFDFFYFKSQKKLEHLLKLIEPLIYEMNNRPNYTYASGYTGLLYFLEIIEEIELDDNSKIALSNYSEKCGNLELNNNHYDYLYGYLGIGLGLLNIKSEFALRCIQQLHQNKKYSNNKIYWTSKGLKGDTDGDLGLAHGAAGVLAILTKFYSKNIDKDCCFGLISEIIDMYRVSKMVGENSIYGYSLDKKESSRLAWCYGDLGIARTIWLAGVACEKEDWKQEAVDIMLHAAKRRDLEKNGVVDAGICHGTSGIAHIFNRFYRDTKLPEFKEATDYWIEQTLLMARFKDGLAGFKTWQGPKHGWTNEYGLLEGIAGIGLVLNSYLHPEIEPTWDRCLLLS